MSLSVIVFLVAGFLGFQLRQEDPVVGKTSAEMDGFGGDVVGTSAPTSTPTGVCFSCTNGGMSATSSYVKKIGGTIEVASFHLLALAASTTAQGGAEAQFDVQASNDYGCETTATSDGNEPLVSEINWFGIDNLNNAVHSGLTSGSSTSFVKWTLPLTGQGQTIVLNHLNYECLKLNIQASSTLLYASLKTK